MMTQRNAQDGTVSWKQIAAICAVMAGVAGIHGSIMIPVIKNEMAPEIQKAIKRHASQPLHPGAVPRGEFNMIIDRLNKIDTKIDGLRE